MKIKKVKAYKLPFIVRNNQNLSFESFSDQKKDGREHREIEEVRSKFSRTNFSENILENFKLTCLITCLLLY